MKKTIILLLVLIFTFTSCVNSEINENMNNEKLDNENNNLIKESDEDDLILKKEYEKCPPEYYAKTCKVDDGVDSDEPDGRLYDPLYLEFEGNLIKKDYELSYSDENISESCIVTLVVEQLFNGMNDKACHIYFENESDINEYLKDIDWYIVEKGEEIFRFYSEDSYLSYKDDFYEVGSTEAPAVYIGGEDLVQLGSVEEGYTIGGRKRGDMGYCMIYAYETEDFKRNHFTEEFIWSQDIGLIGYNYKEYLENGEIKSLSLRPYDDK